MYDVSYSIEIVGYEATGYPHKGYECMGNEKRKTPRASRADKYKKNQHNGNKNPLSY